MAGIFSTLSVARSALLAQSAAIRTVGQNIANADTEGYTRQRVQFAAARPERLGRLSIGSGVEVSRIERVIDQHLEESLRRAATSLEDLSTRSKVLGRIESVFNELDEEGIGPALDRFFQAVNDWSVRPEDSTARRQVIASADALADAFNYAGKRLIEIRSSLNDEVETGVGEINRMASEIAQLNGQIVEAENGGRDLGTANDLRDRRDLLLHRLGELVDLKAIETSTGAVNIMVNGQWLVFGKHTQQLETYQTAEDGIRITKVRMAESGAAFAPESGKFGALLAGRDSIVPGFMQDLDKFANTIIGEINRVHSTGEGLRRFSDLTGTVAVSSPTAPLSELQLPLAVSDGRFFFTVKNESTGRIDRYDIAVNLTGSQSPMSLQDLAAAINAAVADDHPEIEASVTNDFRFRIRSTESALTFGFEEDTTGVLAALGLNTLFTGAKASDMSVNDLVRSDPALLAAGQGDGPGDNRNALAILALRDKPLIEQATLEDWWHGKLGALGVQQAQAKELAENQQRIVDHLTNQREALSGVNIDEEAINLITYQRAFQGAARLLAVVDSLVATLLDAV